METTETKKSIDKDQEIGLTAVKTTILDSGIESVEYGGTPLPSNFSIQDRIKFYLSKK